MKLSWVMLTIALPTLVVLPPAEGKPRPTVDSPDGETCFNDPTTDKNCQSPTEPGDICYCCYDDGCWICGRTPMPSDACVWDDAYRARLGAPPLTGPLAIGPESGQHSTQEGLINLLEKKGVMTRKELLEEIMGTREARVKGALEGGRLEASVAAQKTINRYFHTDVVPKLKSCWNQVEGAGKIEMQFRFEDDGKGRWAFKTLTSGDSSLPKGQDQVALACMQRAVAATSFPKEEKTGDTYSINWDWPVPLPQDAARAVERMFDSSGGEGAGCDGHGAPKKCVTCAGFPVSCTAVCVGTEPPCAMSEDPIGGMRSCREEGKQCASGGPFGVVGSLVAY